MWQERTGKKSSSGQDTIAVMNLEQLWTSVLRIGLSKVRHGWRSGWWLKRPFRLMTELLSADRFRIIVFSGAHIDDLNRLWWVFPTQYSHTDDPGLDKWTTKQNQIVKIPRRDWKGWGVKVDRKRREIREIIGETVIKICYIQIWKYQIIKLINNKNMFSHNF